jgi:SAM-dependent methyltransferase
LIYDNTQENSDYFNNYLGDLAKRLIEKYDLLDKNVVEVGCGKGHFIKTLFKLGVKNIQGYDPTYKNHDTAIDQLVVKKVFNKENINRKVDFIICRHVLEHVNRPLDFVTSMESCLKHDGVMYFEFPDLDWIIKNETFFDFFYEHCNYFAKRSVLRLFGIAGFKNIIFKYGLNDQYFQIEVSRKLANEKSTEISNMLDFSRIPIFIDKKIILYQKIIEQLDSFVVWGAGAKGVTFLNRLNITRDKCAYVIDVNPNKQNKFIPTTGQKIVAPKILNKIKPKTIIIMNSFYEDEIKKPHFRTVLTANLF